MELEVGMETVDGVLGGGMEMVLEGDVLQESSPIV